LDADLQDPPYVIESMLEKWREGNDIVLAVRKDRSSDSWLKRSTAQAFYALINHISEVSI